MSAEPDPASTMTMILEVYPQPPVSSAPDTCSNSSATGCQNVTRKGKKFTGRYCHYYGQYYCTSCHKRDKMIIPAMLVKNWDRKKYEICRAARDYLKANMDKPMIDLMQANHALYTTVEALQKVQYLRIQFSMMKVGQPLPLPYTHTHTHSLSLSHTHTRSRTLLALLGSSLSWSLFLSPFAPPHSLACQHKSNLLLTACCCCACAAWCAWCCICIWVA